ncbi:class III lanthionine synthetase LanKC [Saccharicrinis aurantiacus]|uniref:class III lanthionine synthetase LanKC n=1 Tax=Saccharicrinis aurantiacus TaxID=1849719 RepID=UPI0008380805|nr:class III lanthionine synthetase LanKC [Saccharicrinis aurantiacus]
MAVGIERRLKRDIFIYCVSNAEYFDTLHNYKERSKDYYTIINKYLHKEWSIQRSDIWYHIVPENIKIPLQGFKIHISATSPNAIDILQLVVPVCIEENVPFKVIIDYNLLNFSNSKNFNRASSGKFITIYPLTLGQFKLLVDKFNELTSKYEGPYILSDKSYKESRTVFYRYGGFINNWQLNVFGEKVPLIKSEDGELVKDSRVPYFQLPEGIKDPFPTENKANGTFLIGGKFSIKSCIQFSNSGGVYIGENIDTGEKVLIKEARPNVGITADKYLDAIGVLKKEYDILKKLEKTNFSPKAIMIKQEWEHYFLIEEFIEGRLLSSYRALEDIGLLLQVNLTNSTLEEFYSKFTIIAKQIIEAVDLFHKEGIIVGDLAPQNIIVELDTLKIKFIDFEGAYIVGDSKCKFDPTFTLGFGSPEKVQSKRFDFQDDYYAIGAVLYSLILPIQTFFSLSPTAKDTFINDLYNNCKISIDLKQYIMNLMNEYATLDIKEFLIKDKSFFTTPKLKTIKLDSSQVETEIKDVLPKITNYILDTIDYHREDRLSPSDYRVFNTNPLSIAYGATGIALHLKENMGRVPDNIIKWILSKDIDNRSYPPGLFMGMSGIAMSLGEFGYDEESIEIMHLALSSNLLFESSDIFYGAGGWGMVCLYFWRNTRDNYFISKAIEAGEYIIKDATVSDQGFYWENIDNETYYGYGSGGSGISLFLLYLYIETKDQKFMDYAIGGINHEISKGVEKENYITWERSKDSGLFSPYWRYGTAGIGSTLIRFYYHTGIKKYKYLAEKASIYVSTKYSILPSQFVGLSGIGEFFLDMYLFTKDDKYREKAFDIADGILSYKIIKPNGVAFPGEELLRISNDFGTGSAGIGLFFSRLLDPKPRLLYDFNFLDIKS